MDGMVADSRSLLTVPTKENTKCRIWVFNRCFFFFNKKARIYV